MTIREYLKVGGFLVVAVVVKTADVIADAVTVTGGAVLRKVWTV